MGAVLGNALQGLSTRWEQQHRRPPALDVPQDARRGGPPLCFPARILFAGRRDCLISQRWEKLLRSDAFGKKCLLWRWP